MPVPVKNISTSTAVIGGCFRFCAQLSTGHVNSWVYGGDGELGDRTFNSSDVPVTVHAAS